MRFEELDCQHWEVHSSHIWIAQSGHSFQCYGYTIEQKQKDDMVLEILDKGKATVKYDNLEVTIDYTNPRNANEN